jgi:hypothetical protein
VALLYSRVAIEIEVIASQSPIVLTQGRPLSVTFTLTRKCSASTNVAFTTTALNVYLPSKTSLTSTYAANTCM